MEHNLDAVAADWPAWLDERRRRVDELFSNHLKVINRKGTPHSRLAAAVEYSITAGGKRVRPVLVLESCRVCGGSEEAAIPAALAVECVHTFSLIHDDLPAMDDDDLRRGVPTNHKVFGDALAILAGDWLMTHALALLASENVPPDVSAALVRALAAGTLGMIEGQAADIESEGLDPDGELVKFIHVHKTAKLIEACCRMGALCAKARPEAVAAMAAYGYHLGLAFQIVDDLLDRTGSTEKTGKRVGKDADVSKQTYPAAFGIEPSRQRARRETAAALAALEPFDDRAARLRDLARYVIARDH